MLHEYEIVLHSIATIHLSLIKPDRQFLGGQYPTDCTKGQSNSQHRLIYDSKLLLMDKNKCDRLWRNREQVGATSVSFLESIYPIHLLFKDATNPEWKASYVHLTIRHQNGYVTPW